MIFKLINLMTQNPQKFCDRIIYIFIKMLRFLSYLKDLCCIPSISPSSSEEYLHDTYTLANNINLDIKKEEIIQLQEEEEEEILQDNTPYILLLSNIYKFKIHKTINKYTQIFPKEELQNIKSYGISFHDDPNKVDDVYLYNDKIYKFYTIRDIKTYLEILSIINEKKIKNILLPEYIYYCEDNNKYIEIYPYYNNGDLFNYKIRNHITNLNIVYIFKKIIKIILELHNNGIVHRDIKLENFLIDNRNNKFNIILIDLDYAHFYNKDLEFRGGSSNYVSPEILNDNIIIDWKYNDIWACGIILYILIFTEVPWQLACTKNEEYCEYLINPKYLDSKFVYSNKYKSLFLDILKNTLTLDNRCDINYINTKLNLKIA